MSALEGYLVSEFAIKKANRTVAEAMAHDDLIERICALIETGHNLRESREVLEAHPGEWPHLRTQESFQHGVLVAVDVLIRAGLTEDKMPIDGLRDLVMKVSLGADSFMEAQYAASGGDIRNLYIEEDGGNG